MYLQATMCKYIAFGLNYFFGKGGAAGDEEENQNGNTRVVWLLAAAILLILIAFAERYNLSKPMITDFAQTYSVGTFFVVVILAFLRKRGKSES